MEGPVHCISCNITFPSQACLDEHLPCSNSSFDLSKVKTEADDTDEEFDSTEISSALPADVCTNFSALNPVKTEVKTEIPDYSEILSNMGTTEVTHPNLLSAEMSRQGRGRGTRSRARGTRGGRGRLRASHQRPTTTSSRMQPSPSGTLINPRAKGSLGTFSPPPIRPKPGSAMDLKINGVYFTNPESKDKTRPGSMKSGGIISVPVSAVVNTSNKAAVRVQTAVSNSPGVLPGLAGQNIIGGLPFNPLMIGNTILQNPQQGPLFLGGARPVLNPLQSTNSLQPSGLLPGIQNLTQQLQGLQALGMPQNNLLNLQPSASQSINPLVQNGTATNLASGMGTVVGQTTIPHRVPVLVGNQIILMDVPSFPMQTNLSPATAASTLNGAVTQKSTVLGSDQTTRPSCQNNTGTTNSSVAVISSGQLHIPLCPVSTQASVSKPSPRIPQPTNLVQVTPLSAGASSVSTLTSPPPMVIGVSSASCSQPQLMLLPQAPKLAKTNSSANSLGKPSESKLSTGIGVIQSKTSIAQNENLNTEEVPDTKPVISSPQLVEDVGKSCGSSKSGHLGQLAVKVSSGSASTNLTASSVSGLASVSLTVNTVPSVVTSSAHQPVVSPTANTSTVLSHSGPLLNFQNLMPQSSAASLLQQPIILTPQQQQSANIFPVLSNMLGFGNAAGLLYPNTLGVQRPSFVMDGTSGQNVWIQNITNNQPIVIGNNTGHQPAAFGNTLSGIAQQPQVVSVASTSPSSTSQAGVRPVHVSIKAKSPPRKGAQKSPVASVLQEIPDTVKNKKVGAEPLSSTKALKHPTIVKPVETSDIKFCVEKTEPLSPEPAEIINQSPAKEQQKGLVIVGSTSSSTDQTEILQSGSSRAHPELKKGSAQQKAASETSRKNHTIASKDDLKAASTKQIMKEYFDPETGLLLVEHFDFNTGLLGTSAASEYNSTGDKESTPKAPDFSVFFNDDKDSPNSRKESLFVGPLTKEELNKIVQNPTELEKYINIPSKDIIIASKAIAVPASAIPSLGTNPSLSTSVSMCRDTLVPAIEGSGMSSPSSKDSLDHSTVIQTLQSSPNLSKQTTVSSATGDASTSHSSNSTIESVKTNFTGSSHSQKVEDVAVVDLNEVCRSHDSRQSRQLCRSRRRKFTSEKRREELKRLEEVQKQKNELMRLSFVGDISLLKDALRRSTVPLERVSVGSYELKRVVDYYNRKRAGLEVLDSESDITTEESSPKAKKRQTRKRKLEKEMGADSQRQWVPLEVIGDLAVRGRLCEDDSVSTEESDNQGKRRSNRISAKPKLDYADLEKLPFKDLDEELGDSDSDFELSEETFEIVHEVDEDMDMEETLNVPDEYKEKAGKDSMVRKDTLKDLRDELIPEVTTTRCTAPPSSLPDAKPLQLISVSSSDVSALACDEKDNSLVGLSSGRTVGPEIMDLEVDSIGENEPPDKSTAGSDVLSIQGNTKDHLDDYYSSESESDMFDSSEDVASAADKKKLLWKHHNEITKFLIKHAGKFHSEDEKDEHYCNICNKYKTNGIFSLSKHLKKHLSGCLKCMECSFEACNEEKLAEHYKTQHKI